MTRRARVVAAVLCAVSIGGVMSSAQEPAAIRGVWRLVSRDVPATTTPGARVDPFGHVPPGLQTAVQPGLLLLTDRHFSRTTDTAVEPRPTGDYAVPGRPTVEELQARFGPFAANAGRYELDGDVLTLWLVVANEPRAQRPGSFARLRVHLTKDTLSLTPIANEAGRIAAGVMSTYQRVE